MWFALLPYFYFIKTRLNKPVQQVSWLFVYFIPILIFYLVYGFQSVFTMLLAYYIVNLVYENGYIQNDIITSRKETSPTSRLNGQEYSSIYYNIKIIFLFRFFVFLVLTYILYKYCSEYEFFLFLILLVFLQLLFIFYNLVRSRLNFYLILPLSYLRFYLPLIPFLIIDQGYSEVFALTFVYPFAKFLELSKESKFNFKFLPIFIGQIDRFRVWYYTVVSVVFMFLFFYFSYAIPASLALVAYYFVYRLFGYFFYSNSSRFKSLVNSGAKKEFRK